MNQVRIYQKRYNEAKKAADQAEAALIAYLAHPQIASLWCSHYNVDSNNHNDVVEFLDKADVVQIDVIVETISEFLDLHED